MKHERMTDADVGSATDQKGTVENEPGDMRFGVIMLPDAPVHTLVERIRQVEALGFDQLYFPDHIADLRELSGVWLDGWSVLVAAAAQTEKIRVGMMVSNPILRPPAVLAKLAVTVDHLSGGRLDLGVGAGTFAFDHEATGTEPWSPKERAGRFAEYVEIVDGILRGAGRPYGFQGRSLWVRNVHTSPPPIQLPRPPLIVGGQSPTVLRVAADRADVWNTIGPMGAGFEDIVDITVRQSRHLDELCAAAGRDPSTLRRSLTLFEATDPWSSPVNLEQIADRFAPAGVTEIMITWPPAHRYEEFERLALDTIPALRGR